MFVNSLRSKNGIGKRLLTPVFLLGVALVAAYGCSSDTPPAAPSTGGAGATTPPPTGGAAVNTSAGGPGLKTTVQAPLPPGAEAPKPAGQ